MSLAASAKSSSRRPAGPDDRPQVTMVGAGQLAQMTHQASIGLNIDLTVLASGPEDSAVRAGAGFVLGSYESLDDLRHFAAGGEVLTFDHEGVPFEHLEALVREGFNLAPGPSAQILAQDKLHARRTLRHLGLPVPDFEHAVAVEDGETFGDRHGWPIVAKAPRGGYDGRGVWTLEGPEELKALLDGNSDGLLLEPRLPIILELAVLVARSVNGESVAYPVVETVQREAMCREIIVPAPIEPELAAEATRLALAIAEQIESTGILAVELFVTADGLLINELALRPHNSGHFSIEGCSTSQFEQHLRAILGLPLGSTALQAPAVATVNVVGRQETPAGRSGLDLALAVPGAHVHLYGKESRPGRKIGHVTVCGDDPAPVIEAARLAASALEGDSA